jgi:hypothetical protein
MTEPDDRELKDKMANADRIPLGGGRAPSQRITLGSASVSWRHSGGEVVRSLKCRDSVSATQTKGLCVGEKKGVREGEERRVGLATSGGARFGGAYWTPRWVLRRAHWW